MKLFLIFWALFTAAMVCLGVWLNTPLFIGFAVVLLLGFIIGNLSGNSRGTESGWLSGYDLGYTHGEDDAARASLPSEDSEHSESR